MPHPSNKKDRFLKGMNKGLRRAEGLHETTCKRDPDEHSDLVSKTARHTRHTTKLCSCPMCGNKRKFFKEKTMQEKKFDESLTEK